MMDDLLIELENRCEALLAKVAHYRAERDLTREELDTRHSEIADLEAENQRLRDTADSYQHTSETQVEHSEEGRARLLHLLKRINSAG